MATALPLPPMQFFPGASNTGSMERGGGAYPSGETDPLYDLARFLTTRDTAARTTDATGIPVGDGPAIMGLTTVSAPLLDPAIYRAVASSNEERYLRYQHRRRARC